MRSSMLPLLRCPRCRTDRSLSLTARAGDEREVRDGELACSSCATAFEVRDGIAHLLHDPPQFVAREAAGLERFAELMAADGWDRERILQLPDVHLGYWVQQRKAFYEVVDAADFQPGQRLLDVGSNTCWASNLFARRGLEVVALDIATTRMQGLRTADWFLETGEVYFERLLSVMYDPAVASESMDVVFCCEVLHHNDRANLARTLREMYRVLVPGGLLFLVNEPLRFLFRPKLDHGDEVAQFDGNEHVYFAHEYYRAARAAGFQVSVPWMRGVEDSHLTGAHRWSHRPRLAAVERAIRRRAVGRWAIAVKRVGRWAWRHVLVGDRALFLECRKPSG